MTGKKEFVPHDDLFSGWSFIKGDNQVFGIKYNVKKLFKVLDDKGEHSILEDGQKSYWIEGSVLITSFTDEEYNKLARKQSQ
jgi:hypothetical protein